MGFGLLTTMVLVLPKARGDKYLDVRHILVRLFCRSESVPEFPCASEIITDSVYNVTSLPAHEHPRKLQEVKQGKSVKHSSTLTVTKAKGSVQRNPPRLVYTSVHPHHSLFHLPISFWRDFLAATVGESTTTKFVVSTVPVYGKHASECVRLPHLFAGTLFSAAIQHGCVIPFMYEPIEHHHNVMKTKHFTELVASNVTLDQLSNWYHKTWASFKKLKPTTKVQTMPVEVEDLSDNANELDDSEPTQLYDGQSKKRSAVPMTKVSSKKSKVPSKSETDGDTDEEQDDEEREEPKLLKKRTNARNK